MDSADFFAMPSHPPQRTCCPRAQDRTCTSTNGIAAAGARRGRTSSVSPPVRSIQSHRWNQRQACRAPLAWANGYTYREILKHRNSCACTRTLNSLSARRLDGAKTSDVLAKTATHRGRVLRLVLVLHFQRPFRHTNVCALAQCKHFFPNSSPVRCRRVLLPRTPISERRVVCTPVAVRAIREMHRFRAIFLHLCRIPFLSDPTARPGPTKSTSAPSTTLQSRSTV